MQKYHDEPKQYKGYLKSALGCQLGCQLTSTAVLAELRDVGCVRQVVNLCSKPEVA